MSGSVAVFLGPTLRWDEAAALLPGADLRPPAAQGDLVAATHEGVDAIVLVDGAFETVPAVWHKDILWALARRVAVYGAASMGALRAAEMAPFGMVGVGRVVAEVLDGTIVDDDEVAVRCCEINGRWEATSTALVDIRHALEAAVAEGVLPSRAAAGVVAAMRATYYVDRTADGAVAVAKALGVSGERERRLRALLAPERSSKASDARAALTRVTADRRTGRWPVAAVHDPAWTHVWLAGSASR